MSFKKDTQNTTLVSFNSKHSNGQPNDGDVDDGITEKKTLCGAV